MCTVLKIFIESVTVLLLFYALGFFFFWLRGLWDSQLPTPCTGRRSLNHWTAKEAPSQ